MTITDIRETGLAAASGLLTRPVIDVSRLEETVGAILSEVRSGGDDAVRKFSLQFDKVAPERVELTAEEIAEGAAMVDEELKAAIRMAKENIEAFHRRQERSEDVVETMPGVRCWRKSVAIEKVGLYIPGGTAPLFSTLLMLAIPAGIAGCREIVLCSPPDAQGRLHPALLYAAGLVGVTRVFRVGGVQAIGAMAYGTESIPAVYKIFGPGNQYVTCAKQLVQRDGVAIDMPAGPSEVAVYADETADAGSVAADLLSQAEHGADSQVVLVSSSVAVVERVLSAVDEQVALLPRAAIARKALTNSRAFIVRDGQQAMELLNEYAPEHLILACDDAERLASTVVNAGSVFLGHYSPESVGDYASGTNHVLPTNGAARAFSGVSLDSFVKKITFQQLSREGLEAIGGTVMAMASAEGLEAHARAVTIRIEK
ncbi:histidinol dehydrogenase [Puia dinghuensis]|uniref:Histidinol dehydrogenase n=1 Tax=Puia dinghuensis TaxID=1792502 RepID=A0A8J2UAV5_9BACT|nr:histidinol dehydrogenase [Puia dinghuensis]GGA91336.1 histidinol dehydrogenase [Puia dinghuensis]